MAVEQQAPPLDIREQWIEERVAEFAIDPAQRDRALAIILWDSLKLNEMMNELAEKVRAGGVGGLIKGLMSGKG